MSMKSVEMQIAIPKTVDAGKMQNDLQNRTIAMHADTHISVEKSEQEKRKTVVKNDESNRMKEKKDGDGNNRSPLLPNGKGKRKKKTEYGKHPFKGKFIDYKG
ncbi:hypothetical protein [Fervidibacillus albus]|uniref:Uncharacterized protein n=1 Tax=Fervidibacillus albus TaxID=2980026 RepID=A0A9E8RWY2_9BACI|nr:hypothetical protein [Fervidibacillus albus]WAA10739.1 hypothetical protein OE104_05325 [Fervidibacillus albus]